VVGRSFKCIVSFSVCHWEAVMKLYLKSNNAYIHTFEYRVVCMYVCMYVQDMLLFKLCQEQWGAASATWHGCEALCALLLLWCFLTVVSAWSVHLAIEGCTPDTAIE
jgi:hypothetical protein